MKDGFIARYLTDGDDGLEGDRRSIPRLLVLVLRQCLTF